MALYIRIIYIYPNLPMFCAPRLRTDEPARRRRPSEAILAMTGIQIGFIAKDKQNDKKLKTCIHIYTVDQCARLFDEPILLR